MAYHASDEILINSISNYAMEGVERLERASKKLFGGEREWHIARWVPPLLLCWLDMLGALEGLLSLGSTWLAHGAQ